MDRNNVLIVASFRISNHRVLRHSSKGSIQLGKPCNQLKLLHSFQVVVEHRQSVDQGWVGILAGDSPGGVLDIVHHNHLVGRLAEAPEDNNHLEGDQQADNTAPGAGAAHIGPEVSLPNNNH